MLLVKQVPKWFYMVVAGITCKQAKVFLMTSEFLDSQQRIFNVDAREKDLLTVNRYYF